MAPVHQWKKTFPGYTTWSESLAGQEAPNGDICILNSKLGFPHRALQHRDIFRPAPMQFVTGDSDKALPSEVTSFAEGVLGAVLGLLGDQLENEQ